VILGEECHIIVHEAGAAAVIAGVQTRCVPAPAGVLEPEEIRGRLRKRDLHAPATSLICLENAHSLGRAVPLAAMEAVNRLAGEWGLPVHLDGARLFNAALALGCGVRDIAALAGSVMFCLSKGLCAPVGSLLAGPADFIAEARMKRKILGGGMRQAGILAAAGIIALTEHPPYLAEDHRRAKKLAAALAAIPRIETNPDETDINMVYFRFPPAGDPGRAADITAAFSRRGIRINPPENGVFRFVTHYWIGDRELETLIAAAGEIFGRGTL
jgi:threonine aldolase